jgi:hypothetical protein
MDSQLQPARWIWICLFVLGGGVAGCWSNSRPVVNKVKGQVFFKKTQPASGAFIVFHPKSEVLAGAVNGRPFAFVEPDGSFALTTYGKDDGAPAGEYGVTIVWEVAAVKTDLPQIREGKSRGPDQLGGRYGDPGKPRLAATVVAGENEFRFDVE